MKILSFLLLAVGLQAAPTAVIKTFGAPTWSNWVSMRAGHVNQFDGTASVCTGPCTYAWSIIAGPNGATFTNPTSSQPFTDATVVFGTYTIQLIATDGTGSNTATLQVGCVAYDNNGVVIPNDANFTKITGPMMAFGQNPWGYADERHFAAVNLQSATGGYLHDYVTSETWSTHGAGTVSYPFSGKGPAPGVTCTTLTGSITSTSTSIAVADATCLDLTTLPTEIYIGNTYAPFVPGNPPEVIRISATTAMTGAATLTVAYDGRGLQTSGAFELNPSLAGSHSNGDIVGQMKISGTSTSFLTDLQRPICPAGIGPPGAVVYSTGTVTLSASSAVVTGSGTGWNTTNAPPGDTMRISATHATGTPYTAVGIISSVGGVTSITLNRAVPADVDAGPFTYQILGPRYISLEVTDPSGNPLQILQNTWWCESETEMYALPAFDVGAFDGNTYSPMWFSYKDSLGAVGNFGPNFYGTGLALRRFYWRSGYTPALTWANALDSIWVADPEVANGWIGTHILNTGGGVVGAIACLATDPCTGLAWSGVREFGQQSTVLPAAGCNDYDSRDSGYLELYAGHLALFDPDSGSHATWQATLAGMYTRETSTVNAITGQTGCKQNDNSWANGQLFVPGNGPAVTATMGSNILGGSFSPGNCSVTNVGTGTVVNGNATLTISTGTFIPSGAQVIVSGTLGGQPYTFRTGYIYTSGPTALMGGLYPGDTGSITWWIASDQNWSTIAKTNNDPLLQQNWSCLYVDPTHIQIDHVWPNATDLTGDLTFYTSNIAGYGEDSFMLGGIKEYAFVIGSRNPDSTIASHFLSLAQAAAGWMKTTGYDPQTQGINYGRVFQSCEPFSTWSTALVMFRTDGCQSGMKDDLGIRTARAINGEAASNSLSVQYAVDGMVSYQNTAYGSIWGYGPYTAMGYYNDVNYVRDEVSNGSLQAFKYPGFYFGMGQGDQWPATLLTSSGGGNGGSTTSGPTSKAGPTNSQ